MFLVLGSLFLVGTRFTEAGSKFTGKQKGRIYRSEPIPVNPVTKNSRHEMNGTSSKSKLPQIQGGQQIISETQSVGLPEPQDRREWILGG